MKKPLLVSIVGQTATGKTQFALKLATQLLAQGRTRIDLLSADSRQVYHGLETLSGADIPSGFSPTQNTTETSYFFSPDDSVRLYGTACIAPNAEWSAAHFLQLFHTLWAQQKPDSALIVVGGTGLYHQQIFSPAHTLGVKPRPALRQRLEKLPLERLQKKLQSVWPDRWKKMNESDRMNPRRLIRGIEVAQADQHPSAPLHSLQPDQQLGLFLPANALQEKIAARVERRWHDALKEVQQLEKAFPATALPSKTILGYEQILQYLLKHLSVDQAKQAWAVSEWQYAQRQQTWWKKQPHIQWQIAA